MYAPGVANSTPFVITPKYKVTNPTETEDATNATQAPATAPATETPAPDATTQPVEQPVPQATVPAN